MLKTLPILTTLSRSLKVPLTTNRSSYTTFFAYMSTSSSSSPIAPIEGQITNKLRASFSPVHLEVINESYKHNVPKGSETHFKVVIVSEKFQDKSLLDRHRLVNELLKEELATAVHALSIQAKTPKQWEDSQTVADTPGCIRPSHVPMK